MKSSRPWIVYTVIRIAIFAVALTVLLLLSVNPYIAAVIAAVIGLCVSYIFFRGKRDDVAKDIYARRNDENRDADNDLENEALDRAQPDNSSEGATAVRDTDSPPPPVS